MGAGEAAMVLGALVPSGIVSRLLLLLTKRWRRSIRLLIAVHVVSGALSCLISALGHADGGPLDWSYSGIYLAAQAVWFVVDVVRERRRRLASA